MTQQPNNADSHHSSTAGAGKQTAKQPTNKQATWGGRFSTGPAELMQHFSESVSFDKRLAPFDLQGSEAHAYMLSQVGLLSQGEYAAIAAGLEQIGKEIAAGDFQWDITLEDVHMNIEQALSDRVPAAAKLHTARSRNDQVALDMRLFFRDACERLGEALHSVQASLLDLAERVQDVYIPGYTHLQRAQPVSMAHHLLAYVEMFGRDAERMAEVGARANWCPLGSGAIAGTTLPIDREIVAKRLGFIGKNGEVQVTRNSMDAVSDRDLFIEFASVCALIGVHFSRLSEDMILWNSAEFGFIALPDAFTTGSSLMPQKKNPDSFELLRGKAGRLHGHVSALLTMVKGLPLTYNRDLQEDKPPVFDAFDQTLICLQVLAASLVGAEPNGARCAAAVSDPALLATDLVDYLVLKGVAFRNAHHVIGAMVALAEKKGVKLNELSDADVQGLHPIFQSDWREVFDLKRAIAAREKIGMGGVQQVKDAIAHWRSRS